MKPDLQPHTPFADKATIIFIHGYISDSRVWGNISMLWPGEFNLEAPTLRYFGTKAWKDDGEHFGFDDHLEELINFIVKKFTSPVHLVGWSYGASLALALAAHYPHRVASVYAYEPGIASFLTDLKEQQSVMHDRDDMIQPVLMALEEKRLEDAIRCIFNNACGSSDNFECLPIGMKNIFLQNARTVPLMFSRRISHKAPTAAMLMALSMPVTIAVSDQARLAYTIVANRAAAIIPLATKQKILDANHVMPVMAPQRFIQAIYDHISHIYS